MRLLAPLCLIATLGLMACATRGPSTPADTPHMAAGKALKDVADTLRTAAQLADNAALFGLLHGPAAATVAADLKTAQQALDAASAAYQASDDSTAQADILIATTLVADITLIVSQAEGAKP